MRLHGDWISTRRDVASLVMVGLVAVACAPTASAPTAAPAAGSKPSEAAKPAPPAAVPAAPPPAVGVAKPVAGVEPQGSVTLVMPEEVRSLGNHEAVATVAYPVLRNVQEALVNRDPTTGELVGELATKWEQTNPTTWRFHLRQGVKFHDGSPFNAEAAAYGLAYTFDKTNAFGIRSRLGPELTFTAVDENTLDVIATAPDPIVPSRLYFAPFVSMKLLKETPDQYPIKPVGTGPYKFVEWIRGQQIKVEANPDWWGIGNPEARGVVTIKNATFVVRQEREVRSAMVKSGEADMARWLTKEQCQQLPACTGGPGVETIFIRLDQPNPALADKRVRQAVAVALDKNALINDIMGGGRVAGQLVGPGVVGYNAELQPYPYDVEQAKKLIADAKAAGVPVDTALTVVARRGAYLRIEEAAEAVTEMLKKAGLPNVKTQLMETAAHQDMWSIGKLPAPDRGMIGLHSHGNEIMDFGQTVGTYYICDGKQSAYCNPKIDELQQVASQKGGAERQTAYAEIAKAVYDDYATVPIGQPEFYFGLSKRLDWKARTDGFILLKEMKLKE